MKHSAELKKYRFLFLQEIILCEEVFHFKIDYVYDGYGLQRSTARWFEAILKTLPGRKCLEVNLIGFLGTRL